MLARSITALVAAASLSIACSTTVNGADGSSSGNSGPSSGGAPAAQVDECKESCNKMKFFGCNTAEEQAACYSDCGSATASQIELFTACAGTSVCDPECRTSITPKPANGEAPKGTGATESSCTTACQKLVECSFIKVGDNAACLGACASDAYQYQIDCINNTACASLQTACGGGESSGGGGGGGGGGGTVDPTTAVSILRCQDACDDLLGDSCLDAATHAGCRARCEATTSTKRDAFSTCVAQSACTSNDNGCYKAF